jgi:hypothetical protein
MNDQDDRLYAEWLAGLAEPDETPVSKLGRIVEYRRILADRLQGVDDLGAELVQAQPQLADQWAAAIGLKPKVRDQFLPITRSRGAFDGAVFPCSECRAGRHENCPGVVLDPQQESHACPCALDRHPESLQR